MRMMALSVRQPWADLLVTGVKDIENRTWPTNRRGPLLIHASKQWDDIDRWGPTSLYGEKKDYVFGAIIGIVDLVGCVTKHESDWFEGPYGFVLKNARKLKTPIPYKGQLGFFSVQGLDCIGLSVCGGPCDDTCPAHRLSECIDRQA